MGDTSCVPLPYQPNPNPKYRVSRSMRSNGSCDASVIEVDTIIRSCQLFPKFCGRVKESIFAYCKLIDIVCYSTRQLIATHHRHNLQQIYVKCICYIEGERASTRPSVGWRCRPIDSTREAHLMYIQN